MPSESGGEPRRDLSLRPMTSHRPLERASVAYSTSRFVSLTVVHHEVVAWYRTLARHLAGHRGAPFDAIGLSMCTSKADPAERRRPAAAFPAAASPNTSPRRRRAAPDLVGFPPSPAGRTLRARPSRDAAGRGPPGRPERRVPLVGGDRGRGRTALRRAHYVARPALPPKSPPGDGFKHLGPARRSCIPSRCRRRSV